MKRPLTIAIIALIVILLTGAWVYLFVHGSPKSAGDVFTRFGFGDAPPPEMPGTPTVDVAPVDASGTPERLKQLTTRPVAGAAFTAGGIEYVEQGTGHVYSIDLGSGEEKLESGTTIAGAERATFSGDGTYVAVTSLQNGEPNTDVGRIDGLSGKLEGVSLPPGARDIGFGAASTSLYYLLPGSAGASGYAYDLIEGKGAEMFHIPLRDVHPIWGEPLYVYTTPTAHATGYVYRLDDGKLTYVHDGATGLTALPYPGGIVTTFARSGRVTSVALAAEGETTLDEPLIPEKCASTPAWGSVLYCGIPDSLDAADFPDAWYMGTLSYRDSLYRVDVALGTSELVSDMLAESGREVDVLTMGASADGSKVYLINKNDNTLWMYDLGNRAEETATST